MFSFLELNFCNGIKRRLKYAFTQNKGQLNQWLWCEIKIWLNPPHPPIKFFSPHTHPFTSFRSFKSRLGHIWETSPKFWGFGFWFVFFFPLAAEMEALRWKGYCWLSETRNQRQATEPSVGSEKHAECIP